MDPTVRLRIASHLHFALRRLCGEDVDVATLLRGGEAAREAFWVCEASGDPVLAEQARRLREALSNEASQRRRALRAAAPAPRAAPQDADWARDTSGFGVTVPAAPANAAVNGSPGWFAGAPWRRRKPGTDRSSR